MNFHNMLYGNPEPWTWKGETSRKRIKSIGLSEQFAGFRVMSLKDFIVLYGRTWSSVVQLTPNENSAYEILVLVDCRDVIGTMTSEIKKKCVGVENSVVCVLESNIIIQMSSIVFMDLLC